MFERFTDEARATVVRAQDVARSTGADRIEPVHLLLAVAVGEGRGAAALRAAGLDAVRARTAATAADDVALSALGVDLDLVRARAEQTFGAGALDPRSRRGHLRFGGSAKRVLREALRAEVGQGRRRLDDGSVLLGVLEVRDAVVAAVLADQGVDPRAVRADLTGARAA
ncbi:Clp amino terminal domain-containing protein, pathogenicity island component [Klenkia marina]|uniref:Clp amino terminal domain-containing protein, pathogenicity island component n=1 Tax=Klenkia marina TaxID=1960309 RepID=A0A1G4Y675_9ACTN|nr:Clp protease N-terminal domain-containing protein [Klenkia marina]SCX49031.1 Clp amino terminal domain-containing protein, pathogenicity island component [Klenkia marina]